MRFVVLAVLVSLSLGCKDKSSESAGGGAAGSAGGARVVVPKGFEPVKKLAARINYGTDAVTLDGVPVFEVAADGVITREQFASLVDRLGPTAKGNPHPVGLVLNGALTYGQADAMIAALKHNGFLELALMSGSGMAMVPLDLADTNQLSSGLRPVVVVDGTGKLELFSLSQQEGTKVKPKLSLDLGTRTSLDELTAALSEIVRRRWPSGPRPLEDRVIVIVMDPTLVVDRLLSVLAAVRSDGKTELFPVIFFASAV